MFIQLVLVLMMLVTVLYLAVGGGVHKDPTVETRAAQVEVERLASFAYATQHYLGRHTGFSGELTWIGTDGTASLRDEPGLPSGLQGASLPAEWKAVVEVGDYVICAPVSERALAVIGKRMPKQATGVVARQGQQDYLVFSPPEQAQDKVNRCNA